MRLETPRLVLREFGEDDWCAVLAYQSDPLYLRYYDWSERSEADVKAFVQMFITSQRESPRTKFQLAVTLKPDGQLIGNCGIRVNNPEWREANIGYELDSHYWHQGYATEATRAILAFGFDELQMHRIWAWCVADNVGSARVLEKIGMRLEGREREKELIKGRCTTRSSTPCSIANGVNDRRKSNARLPITTGSRTRAHGRTEHWPDVSAAWREPVLPDGHSPPGAGRHRP